ncbi:MAG: hypothetical protein ACOCQR_01820 [bacterium]
MDFKKIFGQLDDKKWEVEKKKWRDDIKKISLPQDMEGQGSMIIAIEYQLDDLYSHASFYYSKYRTSYENIQDYIKAIEKVYGEKGGNPQERSANAYKMILYYPSGDKKDQNSVNLLELQNKIRERYYFFRDFVMDNLKAKADKLNTNIGASKIEAQIGSSYGAKA